VTVLNTDGVIMASGSDSFSASPTKMLMLEKTVGKELHDNVMQTLAPYLGPDNLRVSVALRLNTDKRQTNETNFNPESKAERSVRTVKETGSALNSNGPKSSVGVEQNIPADQAPTGGAGEQSKKQNERREELTNYEVSSKTIQTVSEGYKIESMTIAVVVNRKRMMETLGEGGNAEGLQKQLKEVERLVETAAGADAKRGDRVTVAAVEFMPGDRALEPPTPPGMMAQLLDHTGSFVRAGTILVATLLLIWFGLKPGLRAILNSTPAPAAATPQLQAGALAETPVVTNTAGAARIQREQAPNLIADLTSKMGRTPQKRLEQMIDFDEEQASAILKQWMRGAGARSA
jgi:flagellar M-ring protein FliF